MVSFSRLRCWPRGPDHSLPSSPHFCLLFSRNFAFDSLFPVFSFLSPLCHSFRRFEGKLSDSAVTYGDTIYIYHKSDRLNNWVESKERDPPDVLRVSVFMNQLCEEMKRTRETLRSRRRCRLSRPETNGDHAEIVESALQSGGSLKRKIDTFLLRDRSWTIGFIRRAYNTHIEGKVKTFC